MSRTGLAIEISVKVDTRFAMRIEAAVYKIVEEALTNVMRHASARSVTISRLLEGSVQFESFPGQGTVVRAALPVLPPGNVAGGRKGVAARPSEGRR